METKPSIDLFLINKFQKISDWSQDWFGVDCFGIARLFRDLLILICITETILGIIAGVSAISLSFSLFFNFFFVFIVSSSIRYIEKHLRENPAFSNPVAIHLSFTRTIWGLITIMSLTMFCEDIFSRRWAHTIYHSNDIVILFILYFASCTPKPHKPSKARKLIEKAKESISRLRSPVLKPAYISG
jgi:hypothetical protein